MTRSAVADLNAVIAIAAHKSFRTAAAELAISPSALSHAIAVLERRLGVRLFHRTTRSVALTEAGGELIARVRPALREITDAMTEVAERRDAPSGTLRLNSSAGAARMIVMPIVLDFVARYPNVQVDLVTNDRLVDIVADGFDAGVRAADGVPRDMVAVPCSPEVRFAVVGAPAYFAHRARPVRPGDLAGHACIRTRYSSGVLYRWDFEKRGKQIAFEPAGPLTLDDYPLMIEAALAGVALAYVSQWSVEAHLAAGRLIRVLDDWTPAYPGLCLYYSGHRHVPAALRAFIAVVREHLAAGERGRARAR